MKPMTIVRIRRRATTVTDLKTTIGSKVER